MASRWPPEVFEKMLARVATGERVGDVCAEPDLPSELVVLHYRRANPDFARRWAAAQGRRSGQPVPKALFERVLYRMSRGESFLAVCREPGMPHPATVTAYRKKNPGFAARWDEAMGRRAAIKVKPEEIARVLDRVAAGERLTKICAEPGMPSVSVILKYRRQDPAGEARWGAAFGSRRGAKADLDPARLTSVIEAARSGETWPHLGRRMDWHSVRRVSAVNPEFAARFAAARAAGSKVVARQAHARRLTPAEVYALVEASLPARLHADIRDDVRADLVLGLLSGEIAPENARAAARQAVTAHNRMFARRDMSFDAEIGEGGFTFGGLIADASSFNPDGTGHRVLTAGW